MSRRGFTLIELLVVVAIIGVLSSVVLANLNSARRKARDVERASDMKQILNAVSLFYNTYGCVPRTAGTTCAPSVTSGYSDGNTDGEGGFDISNVGGFMPFLVASGFISQVPVDPINNSTYRYRYYCYNAAESVYGAGIYLAYWKESTGAYTIENSQKDPSVCQ